jgi:GNAT superfamily N-acetyltransferase
MDSEPQFKVERYADVIAEAIPLLSYHWEEIAMFKDKIKLCPAFDKYEEIDKAGGLHIITARVGGRLIGYHVAFVTPHPHYKNNLMSLTDIFFILPEHRKGLLGFRFFQFIEHEMRKLGVTKMMAGTKLNRDLGILFERLGWEPTDRMYSKYIGS